MTALVIDMNNSLNHINLASAVSLAGNKRKRYHENKENVSNGINIAPLQLTQSPPLAMSSQPSSAAPLSKKKKTLKKKQRHVSFPKHVQFVQPIRDEDVHTVPQVPDEDKHLVWYNNEDFHEQHRHDAHYIHYFARDEDSPYRQDLLQILGVACGKLALSEDTSKACRALAVSPIRGLEKESLSCFRQRKKQVVDNVLKSQASLQSWRYSSFLRHQGKCNVSDCHRLLAAHHAKLSAPSRRFARLMGEGDASTVAAATRKESFNKSC